MLLVIIASIILLKVFNYLEGLLGLFKLLFIDKALLKESR